MNPGGLLTWAFLVKSGSTVVHSEADIVGWGKGMTNNRGEMLALLAAMRWLLTIPGAERRPVIIHSDSDLIVRQCSGTCGCRDETLLGILGLIEKAKQAYRKHVTFHWISRDRNKEADALSRTPYKGKEAALEVLKKHKMDIQFDGDDMSW